jgi:transglutaminase/protease-like cytokinesis protein 3
MSTIMAAQYAGQENILWHTNLNKMLLSTHEINQQRVRKYTSFISVAIVTIRKRKKG